MNKLFIFLQVLRVHWNYVLHVNGGVEGRGKLALSCLRDKLIMLVRDSFVLKIFILQVTAESSTVSFICPPEN